MTLLPEEVEKIINEEAEKHSVPVDEIKIGMLSLVLGGWIAVESNPGVFIRTAYHCLRRLPSPSIDPLMVRTLVKNWTVGQRPKFRIMALACLRYAIAKVIYDLGDNAKSWAEPTADICPVRIAQDMGMLTEDLLIEPDFDQWKHADDGSMGKIYKDVQTSCALMDIYPDIPAFGTEW